MKSHNFTHPLFSFLIIGILSTIFIFIVGTSGWLSLISLYVIALIGLLIGAIICDVIVRVQ